MTKPPTILSKPVVVQYKLVTKETNDVPDKKVIGITKKQNFAVVMQG